MLCDEVQRIAFKPPRGPGVVTSQYPFLRRFADTLKDAERFVLTNEVIDLLFHVQETKPSNLLAARPMCRLPFRTIFIEYDAIYRDKVQRQYGYKEGGFPPGAKHVSAGLLIVASDDTLMRGSAYEVTHLVGKDQLTLNPYRLDFDFEPDIGRNTVLKSLTPITNRYDIRFWHEGFEYSLSIGPGPAPVRNRYTSTFVNQPEEVKALYDISVAFKVAVDDDAIDYLVTVTNGDHDLMGMISKDWEGDKRFILSLMVALNSRNCLDIQHRTVREINRHRSVRVRPATLDHKEVRIRLSRTTENRMRAAGASDPREIAWHKVRGHWKLRRTGIFFWRPFTRGNPAEGISDHSYTVSV
jgi:hypothetical protein